MSSEARVGAIFLILIVAITGTVLFMGGVPLWFRNPTYKVFVYFSDIHGLEKGAEVRMAGVKMGTVEAIDVEPLPNCGDKPVKVTLRLNRLPVVHDSDWFDVDQGDVLGTRYIAIRRQAAENSKVMVDGSSSCNSRTTGYAGLPDQTTALLADLQGITHDIRMIFTSQFNQRQVREILKNVNDATRTATLIAYQGLQFATRLSNIAGANDRRIGDLVENMRLSSVNVLKMTTELNRMVAVNPLPADMARAGQDMRGAAQDIHATTAAARDFMTDPALRKQLDEMVANLRQSSESLVALTGKASQLLGDDRLQGDMRQTMANMRDASENIKQATESARKLLEDPEMTGDIKATMHSARVATERGVEVADKASKSLDRVDRTMDTLGGAVASIRPKSVDAWVNGEAALGKGFQGDFNLNLHYTRNPNDFWRLGLSDIGGSERLTLQKSLPIGASSRFRAGLLYGKESVGYDRMWQNSGLEFDLYNPQSLTLDVRGVYRVRNDWDLLVGVDQVFNRNHPFIGVRRWMSDTDTPNK
jgi:ABC-type transporter Mla subunit MlaD